MDFSWISFLIGVGVTALIAWFFAWSERQSLANRAAHGLASEALQFLQRERLRLSMKWLVEGNWGGELGGGPDWADVLPVEDDRFYIAAFNERELGEASVDEFFISVKGMNLFVKAETIYYYESQRFGEPMFWRCDEEFKPLSIILRPYQKVWGDYLSGTNNLR